VTLREKLANLCHEQWSGWMKYLFSKCELTWKDGVHIPIEYAERWQRQMETPYSKLSASEQDSDRKEADKFLALLWGSDPGQDELDLAASVFIAECIIQDPPNIRAHTVEFQGEKWEIIVRKPDGMTSDEVIRLLQEKLNGKRD